MGNRSFREEGIMSNLDYILDFVLEFSEQMLLNGANLERVNDTLYRICDSYGCEDVHFFSLNCFLTLSIKNEAGERVMGQRCVRGGMDTNLENVHRLNQLSRQICANPPDPENLAGMLKKALDTKGYPPQIVWVGYLVAMASLCMINGGTWRDLLVVLLNSTLLFLAGIYLKRPGVNRVVYNIFCTFVVGTIAILLTRVGFVTHFYVVIIVNSLMLIPGISAVNSFRNILCGNEINGILEIFKVILETTAIVGGFMLSIFLFGGSFL